MTRKFIRLVVLSLLLALPTSLLAQMTPGPPGHIIRNEGTQLPQQPYLNFVGASVTCVNDATNHATACTISGAVVPEVFAVGDLLYADTTSSLARLGDVAAGAYLRSGGVGVAPLWSTTSLPNSAVVGDMLYASATNVYSNRAAVAAGSVFASAGVATAPVWSATPFLTSLGLGNGGTPIAGELGAGILHVASAGNGTLLLSRDSADSGGVTVELLKRRSAFGVVSSGDVVATIDFTAADGTTAKPAARIQTVVDATPGASDMPGRLVFSTTADGSGAVTERLRIDNAGLFTMTGTLKYAGTNSTGAGTALLGANSPASTLSAPYTWWTVTTSDGSVGYIPVWK